MLMFNQIKDLFDDALKERTKQWNLMKRYNISDITNLGFPSLDEIGINAVHESYQFLSKNYVENVLHAAKTSEGKKDKEEESKNKRRNSFKTDKFLKPHELRRTNSCKNNILNSENERKANKSSRRNSGGSLNIFYENLYYAMCCR